MWKLGYDTYVTAETDTYVDVTLVISIWTRYSTFDYYNTFSIVGSFGSWTGRIGLTTSTNSAWSRNNIREIKRFFARFEKSVDGYLTWFHVDLTGIEYSSFSYREALDGNFWVKNKRYGNPAPPSNVRAERLSNTRIRVDWSNTNPGAHQAPYQSVMVFAYDYSNNSSTDISWHLPVQQSFTWSGASANKKYAFEVQAFNRDGHSYRVRSANDVYTTPAAVNGLASGGVTVSGSNESRRVSLTLTWNHSSHAVAATLYSISWAGPTSGEIMASERNAKPTGLIPGATYTFTVIAQNPGGGTGILSSIPTTLKVTIPSPPTSATSVSATHVGITGTTAPRSSTYSFSWVPVSGATKYVVKNGSTVLYEGPNTSLTVPGIAAGSKYTLDVYPTNDYGLGAKASVTVTAPGLPTAPRIDLFVPTATGVKVQLSVGGGNGSPITEYQYRLTRSGSEVVPWTRAPGMLFDVDVPSGVYVLHARSVNAVGVGPEVSLSSDATAGRVWIWNGSAPVRASVRSWTGSDWKLTNV